jgi:hypothetical protein
VYHTPGDVFEVAPQLSSGLSDPVALTVVPATLLLHPDKAMAPAQLSFAGGCGAMLISNV